MLFLTVAPSPPEHVTVDDDRSTASSLTVTWLPGSDGGDTQWFYVNYRDVRTTPAFLVSTRSPRLSEANHEYTVTGLRAFTVYEIEVYAENAQGHSESVTEVATTRRKCSFVSFIVFSNYFIGQSEDSRPLVRISDFPVGDSLFLPF